MLPRFIWDLPYATTQIIESKFTILIFIVLGKIMERKSLEEPRQQSSTVYTDEKWQDQIALKGLCICGNGPSRISFGKTV
jgi:hypothetical protein